MKYEALASSRRARNFQIEIYYMREKGLHISFEIYEVSVLPDRECKKVQKLKLYISVPPWTVNL